LPGAETITDLQAEMVDLLLADASDAPQRMGGEDSPLYNNLTWAYAVKRALEDRLATTIEELQRHRRAIENLPMSGEPGKLRADLREDLDRLRQRLAQPNFYTNGADFNSLLTAIQARTRAAVAAMTQAQQQSVRDAQADLQRLPDWGELNQEEQAAMQAQLEELLIQPGADLAGLQRLLNQEYERQALAAQLKARVTKLGYERRLQRRRDDQAGDAGGAEDGAPSLTRTLPVPATLRSLAEMDALMRTLQALRRDAELYTEFTITLQLED
jgi:hypothetical protein